VLDSRRKTLVYVLIATAFLAACSESREDPMKTDHGKPDLIDFEYISVRDGQVHTLHELRYAVSVDGDFKVTKPKSRVARFNDTPFQISLAAFVSDDRALMIHAEKVADSSGASDYSHLPPAKWPDDTFRSSGPDCLQIPAAEIEGEHDLLWLRQGGFEPSGSILYAQYFATTSDMNSEVVISLLQRVASCSTASANPQLIEEFQARASVTRID
jgi:hypothetical protein